MGIAYKNFWSLNIDEAIVTGILRDKTPKNIEVFMPANAQMKNIDLLLMNFNNKKSLTIQVKGSKAYEPKKIELEKYKYGSGGWFQFHKDVIKKATADYFIFLVYVIEQSEKTGRRDIFPHTITIPTYKLKEFSNKYKKIGGTDKYNFYFWINSKDKKSFEFRDNEYSVNEYLDENGFKLLNKDLNNL